MLIYLSILESEEERQVFLDLYNQYGNAMLRVAHHYFPNNQSTAEDAVQNAWLRVVENFSRVQAIPCNKRGAYLVIITKNESISILRKQRQELPFDESVADNYDDFEGRNANGIIEIIRAMPETYRAVLEMRFVEERSTREISVALGLKETTVNVRIHRGRALLMAKLRAEGYVP